MKVNARSIRDNRVPRAHRDHPRRQRSLGRSDGPAPHRRARAWQQARSALACTAATIAGSPRSRSTPSAPPTGRAPRTRSTPSCGCAQSSPRTSDRRPRPPRRPREVHRRARRACPRRTRRDRERLVEATKGGTRHEARARAVVRRPPRHGERHPQPSPSAPAPAWSSRRRSTRRVLRAFLTTGNLPDPDLVIRTGGERRLSDFLLFECAYAELFFTETLWPDFTEETLDEAMARSRAASAAYGRTAEQLPEASAV
jgi:hypothetical protein